MLVTVDLGNTAISVALFEGDSLRRQAKRFTPPRISVPFLQTLIEPLSDIHSCGCIVSSVVPPLDEGLRHSLEELLGAPIQFLNHQTDTGMTIKIDDPNELGADRIADSVGALHFFDPPLIVVDSGTATTLDLVDSKRQYIGGAIFPGIGLSVNALAERTAKLPQVDFRTPGSMVGTNTEESIRAGIFYSYIGGLNHMIREYKAVLGKGTRVIVTGGLIRDFQDKIEDVDLYEPDLIHFGLYHIFQRSKEHGSR
jgi:type III pantothenate kinase